jgi:glycosyltransferase involved in cell wall biosynthesis
MSVYNSEKFLKYSIESILNQTYHNFEFIIIDDGSTDSSVNIINQYKKLDKRIIFIHYQNNKGLTVRLNQALKKSSYNLIARQDSDDISCPKRFKYQVQWFKKNISGVMCGTNAIIIDESSESLASNFEAITKEISNIEIWISEGKQVYDIVKYSKELETNKISLFKQNAEQAYLNRLKMLIIEVTNSSLQNLVDSINECTNNVLEDLFENDIKLELKLFKEDKKTNNLKPRINFAIYYNNNTYDSIMGLSGGEKDRISLALTIALACVNPSPVLFLDECLGTIGNDTREYCIEALKKYVISNTKKKVIIVEHNMIEGFADHIVEI